MDVASPLALRSERWSAIATSPWLVRTITRRYRLQFASVPPRFSGLISSLARRELIAIAPLIRQGIRLATYLDDWLLFARSEQDAETHTRILLQHLQDLGFVINGEKSRLSPAQNVIFLGHGLNSVTFTALLLGGRIESLS